MGARQHGRLASAVEELAASQGAGRQLRLQVEQAENANRLELELLARQRDEARDMT